MSGFLFILLQMFHVKPIIELRALECGAIAPSDQWNNASLHVRRSSSYPIALKRGKVKFMGYPAFGKVKTIVLPAPAIANTSIEEYKKQYGIDLRELFFLKGKLICFKPKNSLLLIDWSLYALTESSDYYETNLGVEPCKDLSTTPYDSGVSDGKWEIKNSSENFALIVTISKDDEFSIENLKISIVDL